MQTGPLPPAKLTANCFSLLEHLSRQTKVDLDKAVDAVLAGKGVKAHDFWRELEKAASTVNELRFYHDILVPKASPKPLHAIISCRKQILVSKQVTNFPGLIMDKIFLTLEEWSSVVSRLFAGHSQPAHSLIKFQTALDHLCKSHANLKPIKENINRLTLTTLLECVYLNACAADRSLDPSGKHIVEQTLVDRPIQYGPTTNLGMIG
jgi:hypothetical protein